jgi:hypothetical protein
MSLANHSGAAPGIQVSRISAQTAFRRARESGQGRDAAAQSSLVSLITKRVAEVTPYLLEDHDYTQAQLAGTARWAAMTVAERHMASQFIGAKASAVDSGLKVAGLDANGNATYRLVTH